MFSAPKSASRRVPKGLRPPLHLHTYLRLLGYEEDKHVRVLSNPRVFEHPSQREFVYVIRFLLGLLNESEAQECFRHCYPPLDKKQEAEFRRKAFNWYKKLQADNPELVPVTPSLFLTPGGRKFHVFLMAFLRWMSRRVLDEDNDQVLGPEFISGGDLPSKTKETFLKSKAKEFKSKALHLNKTSEELLLRGKGLIGDMERRYRETKAEKEGLSHQTNLEDVLTQRIALEERVGEKAKRINDLLSQIRGDLNAIQALEGEKKEPWNISYICQGSLEEYVRRLSAELPPVYAESVLRTKEEMDALPCVASEILSKVRRISEKLSEELLHLKQGVIPFTSNEVDRIFTSLSPTADGTLKCLLPPTPYVDVKAPPTISVPSTAITDTPPSRQLRRIFPKKLSPIHSPKPEPVHLEDCSIYDLRCLSSSSTLSPVLTSSRMVTSPSLESTTLARGCSSKASSVLERFRNLKLHQSSSRSENQSSFEEEPQSMVVHGFRETSSPLLPPSDSILGLPKVESLLEELGEKDIMCSGGSSSPLRSIPEDKSKVTSDSFIGSRLEELIESLGGNSEDIISLSDQMELPSFDL